MSGMLKSRAIGFVGAAAMVACLSVVAAGPAAAQTPGGILLSMDEAVRRGVQLAPRVAEAAAHEAAAQSSVTALKALGLPSANISSQYMRLNDVTEVAIPDGQG